jgi:hypothetical protein
LHQASLPHSDSASAGAARSISGMDSLSLFVRAAQILICDQIASKSDQSNPIKGLLLVKSLQSSIFRPDRPRLERVLVHAAANKGMSRLSKILAIHLQTALSPIHTDSNLRSPCVTIGIECFLVTALTK